VRFDARPDHIEFLADLVLSPMLFLGAALLYLDQSAREKLRSVPRPKEA